MPLHLSFERTAAEDLSGHPAVGQKTCLAPASKHRKTCVVETVVQARIGALLAAAHHPAPGTPLLEGALRWRRRREHCKNPNAAGQAICVGTRNWGRVA
jgi:hypothetical protein